MPPAPLFQRSVSHILPCLRGMKHKTNVKWNRKHPRTAPLCPVDAASFGKRSVSDDQTRYLGRLYASYVSLSPCSAARHKSVLAIKGGCVPESSPTFTIFCPIPKTYCVDRCLTLFVQSPFSHYLDSSITFLQTSCIAVLRRA